MARLQLSFLGTFNVTLSGQPVTGFESGKVRALLAYLATQSERAHTRSVLAALLWPEEPEDAARANLRQALSNLRRALGDQDSDAPFLLISRETVQFNAATDSLLDLAAFNELLDKSDHHAHRRAEACTPCAQWLTQAVELYRAPFLDGMFVQDSVVLEEWILLQREIVQRRVLQALYRLAAYHERRGAYSEAYNFALRQIEIDPWREEAHRQAMRVLVLRGERSAALAQYERCRRLLEEGLGVEPAEETTALYRQISSAHEDAPLTTDQLALPSTHPHNLPPQPTPFIGRELELAELAQVIEQQQYRLISLVGQGGSGKTRIALQVASEEIEGFAGGVRYVPLAPVHSSDYLVSTVGAALGISLSGQKDERTQLLDELREKEMLLVLDNFEHLLDEVAVELLTAILQQAPRVTILTTTRERLNLRGEWVVAVEGLPYPGAEYRVPSDQESGVRDQGSGTSGRRSSVVGTQLAEPAESFAAVQLFLQSARRNDSRFVPTAEEIGAIAGICRMVEGLPLAIELAAAWTPVLSIGEISQEIARSLDFLATNLRDIPERHRSLRAVFDYSWNLLSGDERALLARLSVFRGGFRREAAEEGAGATLQLLSSLLSKSFLRRSPMGRYEMHELLRQYAEGKLEFATLITGQAEARSHHCTYYADYVCGREGKLRGKEQLVAREEIIAEIDNVREAWRWAVEQRKWEEIERLAGGLWFFYEMGGFFQEADVAYERAAAALKESTEYRTTRVQGSGVREQKPSVVGRPSSEFGARYSVLLGQLLARRGAIIGLRMGRVQEGQDLLQESVAIFRQYDERGERAFSLNILGSIARSLCRYEVAKICFEESLQLFKEVGDRWGSAYSLSDLGNMAYLLGNYHEARRLHEESLLISRQTGDRRAMIFCLNDATGVAIALGEYEGGMRSCTEALAISREIGHPWGEAMALFYLGTLMAYTGDYEQAGTLLQKSLAAFQEMGDRQGTPLPLQHLGYLAYLRKEYTQARHLLQQALSICREIGYPRGSAAALNGLGKVTHAAGEEETARSYLREALVTATAIQAWPSVMDALVSIAGMGVASSSPTEQALSLRTLSLVSEHPATEAHTREEAQRLLGEFTEAELARLDTTAGDIKPASLQQIIERLSAEE